MTERALSADREGMVTRAAERAGLRDPQVAEFIAYYLQMSLNFGESFEDVVSMAIDWAREMND